MEIIKSVMLSNAGGSIVLEFIGALIKWIFYAILCALRGKKIVSFRKIWSGKQNGDESSADLLMHGMSNIILGLAFSILLIYLLMYLDRRYI